MLDVLNLDGCMSSPLGHKELKGTGMHAMAIGIHAKASLNIEKKSMEVAHAKVV